MTEPHTDAQRVRLKTRVIEGRQPGPHLLITGGVHGDEFEPVAAIRRLADLIDPGTLRGRVTLVPIVNESAWLRGTRCGEDNRDLARTCPGRPDGSVTEQTAFQLATLIRSCDYYIDLHTGGSEFVVLPLVGYMLHPNEQVLADQRRMARAFNLPIIWGTSSELEGRSLSVARDANVPALYAEYLGGGRCDPFGIQAYVDGCLNVMGELGMGDVYPFTPRLERTVEDSRPGAGHMQVQNPAPMTGFFQPTVVLGQEVRLGDRLGDVFDPTSDDVHGIFAATSGIVLVLRTLSRVLEGQSVGVILETKC